MLNDHMPLIEGIALSELAAHLRVCAPTTALTHVCTEEMRQWYHWMPNTLFRFGRFRFSGESARVYQGGLSADKHLFLLVPNDLYYQHRRAVLIHYARERLGITNQAALRAYCRQAERQLSVRADVYLCDEAILDIGCRVQQVSYWTRLLAFRQARACPSWRW